MIIEITTTTSFFSCSTIFFILDFPDYDGEELNQISGLLARDYGYNYPPEARYATLYYAVLHCGALQCATSHNAALYYAMLHYSIYSMTHYNALCYTIIHFTALNYHTEVTHCWRMLTFFLRHTLYLVMMPLTGEV